MAAIDEVKGPRTRPSFTARSVSSSASSARPSSVARRWAGRERLPAARECIARQARRLATEWPGSLRMQESLDLIGLLDDERTKKPPSMVHLTGHHPEAIDLPYPEQQDADELVAHASPRSRMKLPSSQGSARRPRGRAGAAAGFDRPGTDRFSIDWDPVREKLSARASGLSSGAAYFGLCIAQVEA